MEREVRDRVGGSSGAARRQGLGEWCTQVLGSMAVVQGELWRAGAGDWRQKRCARVGTRRCIPLGQGRGKRRISGLSREPGQWLDCKVTPKNVPQEWLQGQGPANKPPQ